MTLNESPPRLRLPPDDPGSGKALPAQETEVLPRELRVRNRAGVWRVNARGLRFVARRILEDLLGLERYWLGVQLVSGRQITVLNRRWLGREGVTDVIAFDHREETPWLELHGEIFLCPEEAVRQARRYGTTREAELTRYLVHGILHLRGYRDEERASRRQMKRCEDYLLRHLRRMSGKGKGIGAIDFRRVRGEPYRQ